MLYALGRMIENWWPFSDMRILQNNMGKYEWREALHFAKSSARAIAYKWTHFTKYNYFMQRDVKAVLDVLTYFHENLATTDFCKRVTHCFLKDLCCIKLWWRRPFSMSLRLCFDMMASSNGNVCRVTGHLRGEFTSHRWIPRTKASDVFFDLLLKQLSKQSCGWWFETPSHPLWRHCNALMRFVTLNRTITTLS